MRQFIDIITESLLTEVAWKDFNKVGIEIAKWPGKYVHFSSVEKLGINPNKKHSDPHGVYGYPVDWILSTDRDAVHSGSQFGFNWPYYFIFDVQDDGNGLVLSKVTWDQVEQIAQRNGWAEYLDKLDAFKEARKLPYYTEWDRPGSVLWHLLDYLQKAKKISWEKSLKGISFIHDDCQSVINNSEPCQILVRNPRVLKLLKAGRNDPDIQNREHPAVMRPLFRLLTELAKELGGTITWKQGVPTFKATVGEKVLTIVTAPKAWDDRFLTIEANGKGLRRSGYIKRSTYFDLPYDAFRDQLRAYVFEALADDKVEHVVDPEIIPTLISEKLCPALAPESFDREDDIPIEIRHERYTSLRAVTPWTTEQPVSHHVVCLVRKTDWTINHEIKIRGKHFLSYASTSIGDYLKGELDDTEIEMLGKNLADHAHRQVARLVRGVGSTDYRYPMFRSKEEIIAFIGWLLIESKLTPALTKFITPSFFGWSNVPSFQDAYEAYPDKDELHYRIYTVFLNW